MSHQQNKRIIKSNPQDKRIIMSHPQDKELLSQTHKIVELKVIPTRDKNFNSHILERRILIQTN